jgi:hypothetical protein
MSCGGANFVFITIPTEKTIDEEGKTSSNRLGDSMAELKVWTLLADVNFVIRSALEQTRVPACSEA